MINLRSTQTVARLVHASLDELTSAPFTKARSAHGHVITYSPRVWISLTTLCLHRRLDVTTSLGLGVAAMPQTPRAGDVAIDGPVVVWSSLADL
jgi:hypothetical protein